MAYDYDLITIGAGSGGVAASRRAGAYGARVAICEEGRVGGTCVMRGCIPKKLLVHAAHVREEIEDDLREYLKDEIEHAGEGWRPIATERHFEDVPLEGDGKIKVRGAIDRLDRRDSGGVRVVDYKTGRVWEKGDGYRKGRSLQLPIYLKAACHELDAPLEDSRGEYHYSTRKGGFSRPGLDGRDLLADGRFGEVVDSMAEGIASGAFFYWPLAQRRNCRLCDFYDVCQTRVEPLANRKAPGSSDLRKPFERISQDRATR